MRSRLRACLVLGMVLAVAPLSGCDATSPPVDSGPVPVLPTGGTSTGGQPSGGASAAGGFLNHTDCFQGCSRCMDGVYYFAPPHPAYSGDCCTLATQTVCEFGCEVYVGCLPAPVGLGGEGGEGGEGGATSAPP
jgi:hypothetical protein